MLPQGGAATPLALKNFRSYCTHAHSTLPFSFELHAPSFSDPLYLGPDNSHHDDSDEEEQEDDDDDDEVKYNWAKSKQRVDDTLASKEDREILVEEMAHAIASILSQRKEDVREIFSAAPQLNVSDFKDDGAGLAGKIVLEVRNALSLGAQSSSLLVVSRQRGPSDSKRAEPHSIDQIDPDDEAIISAIEDYSFEFVSRLGKTNSDALAMLSRKEIRMTALVFLFMNDIRKLLLTRQKRLIRHLVSR
jgi:hypothetical protein